MQNKGNVNICSAATGEAASERGGEKMAAARGDASRGGGGDRCRRGREERQQVEGCLRSIDRAPTTM